ncbi:hypothetical protein Pint_26979 [Pistacia integerrima]|uniref:Uncharacterized protein n=1 Tax=Pistacia integerrima TaxID=434235 RepID=A0ACC0YQ06_9ROSI|nr:hypothetical protein Pint_26979 [Pistacia integerrima]
MATEMLRTGYKGQAGNGKHTEMNGGQPADGSATTPNNKSSSGQASGQQSAIDNATTATNKSNPGQVSDQRSANDIATTEKTKSSSGQASEKSKKDKLLGTSGSSDQDLGKKTGGTEQPVHNSLPKGDVRQEYIKKNGKDLNPQKGNNSNSEHSLEEQPKGSPRKIEKQKDFGKQPGFKNKDNTNIDTSLPKIVSSARNPSSEQQKDVLKQAKNIENQINTGTSSPIIANSSSLGQGGQILSQEQQKSVTKPAGIKKDVKDTVPSHVEAENSIGEASKQQQKIVGKQDSSYGSHGSSGQQSIISQSNQRKGIREQEDVNRKDKFGS